MNRPSFYQTSASLALVLFLAACAAGGAPGDDDTTAGDDDSAAGDDDSVAGDDDSTPVQLNGTPPDTPLPAPDFTAQNQRGETVGPDQLLGHPTVLWFFPAAGTPG